MKKMTCKDMGGTCDVVMEDSTNEGMLAQGMAHVHAAHPEIVEVMEKMSPEETAKWNADFDAKWETWPEAAAA